ncbi:MAG: hypothetical protein HUJ29_09545 [Gammaproteobacteria bacterium]|nr:hypothetical protein [Gammaproteobacteria bacterium]
MTRLLTIVIGLSALLTGLSVKAEGVIYDLEKNGICNKTANKMHVGVHNRSGIIKWNIDRVTLSPQTCSTGKFYVSNNEKTGKLRLVITDFTVDTITFCDVELKGGWNNTSHDHKVESVNCYLHYGPNKVAPRPVAGHGSHSFHIDMVSPN